MSLRPLSIAALFLAALGISSCQEGVAPQENPLKSVARDTLPNRLELVYWVCAETADGAYDYGCYTVYSGSGFDYWDAYGDFHTTKDCTKNRTNALYCDGEFQPGGNSGNTGPITSAPSSEEDIAYMPVPTCPVLDSTRVNERAYCAGAPLDSTQKARIRDALAFIRLKGGVCAELADAGLQLIARPNTIRVFPQSSFGFSAAAGGRGVGIDSPNTWLVISNRWTDIFYDQAHPARLRDSDYKTYNLTLGAVVIHELDHLIKGLHHIQLPVSGGTVTSKLQTPNTAACSDIPLQS